MSAPSAAYVFRFLTSHRRGAGTTSPVRVLSLAGSAAKRGPFGWWWAGGFPTGSVREFKVEEQPDLGVLHSLDLEVAAEGDGWLLDAVEVSGPGALTRFNHGEWLGDSDAADGQSGPRRVLLRSGGGATHAASPLAPSAPLNRIITAAAAIPERTKLVKGVRAKLGRLEGGAGEDAYFISPSQTRFGVSDGVSQWSEQGIDAGLFARYLAKGALEHGSVFGAYQEALKHGVKGSATLLLVDVDLNKALANVKSLGDSKCVLVRDGKVIERTVEQEHGFGMPFQLSSQLDARDRPEHALSASWPLRSGDVLVAASDGLFDNVMEADIAAMVQSNPLPVNAARALVHRGWLASQDTFGKTPYSIAASEAFDLAFSGGKLDDVTCVCARVE